MELLVDGGGLQPDVLSNAHHRPDGPTAAFIFSEVTFFGALIVAYLEYRTRSPGPGPHELEVPRTLLFSLFLFASSGTVCLAERRLAKDEQRGFLTWWLASIGLGAVFLIGQITEYARLYADGITIGTN